MSNWPFVIAAYAIALGGTALLILWAAQSMRSAEGQAESLKHRQ